MDTFALHGIDFRARCLFWNLLAVGREIKLGKYFESILVNSVQFASHRRNLVRSAILKGVRVCSHTRKPRKILRSKLSRYWSLNLEIFFWYWHVLNRRQSLMTDNLGHFLFDSLGCPSVTLIDNLLRPRWITNMIRRVLSKRVYCLHWLHHFLSLLSLRPRLPPWHLVIFKVVDFHAHGKHVLTLQPINPTRALIQL